VHVSTIRSCAMMTLIPILLLKLSTRAAILTHCLFQRRLSVLIPVSSLTNLHLSNTYQTCLGFAEFFFHWSSRSPTVKLLKIKCRLLLLSCLRMVHGLLTDGGVFVALLWMLLENKSTYEDQPTAI
jgi:hypothetical protein